MKTQQMISLMAWCLLLGSSVGKAKASYDFTTFDVPDASGDIVGEFDDADSRHHGFLRRDGYTAIDVPNATWTSVDGSTTPVTFRDRILILPADNTAI